MREEKGAAATLAIFTTFVILCSVVALHTFEAGYQRQLNTLQQRMATDTTKAVAAAVEAELNDALRTAIGAAMYESGKKSEDKDGVENRLREYFNERIERGWSYSNFENIYVPPSDENSLVLEWLPDGGLRAYGYLNASFTHIMGTKAYGIKLDAGVVPRYGRLMYLAYLVFDNENVKNMSDQTLLSFQENLNRDYLSEFLYFELWKSGNNLGVKVTDNYGGRAIVA